MPEESGSGLQNRLRECKSRRGLKLPLDKSYNVLYNLGMNTVAISDFRTKLPSFISEVSDNLKRLIITVSGQPKAVVLSFDELESLEETAEVLSTPGALESIKKAQKEVSQGKLTGLGKLEKKYQL